MIWDNLHPDMLPGLTEGDTTAALHLPVTNKHTRMVLQPHVGMCAGCLFAGSGVMATICAPHHQCESVGCVEERRIHIQS